MELREGRTNQCKMRIHWNFATKNELKGTLIIRPLSHPLISSVFKTAVSYKTFEFKFRASEASTSISIPTHIYGFLYFLRCRCRLAPLGLKSAPGNEGAPMSCSDLQSLRPFYLTRNLKFYLASALPPIGCSCSLRGEMRAMTSTVFPYWGNPLFALGDSHEVFVFWGRFAFESLLKGTKTKPSSDWTICANAYHQRKANRSW